MISGVWQENCLTVICQFSREADKGCIPLFSSYSGLEAIRVIESKDVWLNFGQDKAEEETGNCEHLVSSPGCSRQTKLTLNVIRDGRSHCKIEVGKVFFRAGLFFTLISSERLLYHLLSLLDWQLL